MIRLWRIEWFERTPPIEQVDFGNGHWVSAADLLDGHFRQLAAQSDNTTQTTSQTVAVQPEIDRHAMIEVVAPTLLPLTDVAEAVAQTLPEAHPALDFRNTLNKALTETHRQHSAQRILGIRPVHPETDGWRNLLVLTLLMTIITLGVALYGRYVSRATLT